MRTTFSFCYFTVFRLFLFLFVVIKKYIIVLYFNVHSLLLNFLFDFYLSLLCLFIILRFFNILFVSSLYCIVSFYFDLKYNNNITSRTQASGERRRVLHRRPRICMPNH